MLQNIKSSYFIKLIYTFLDEAQKLKLVKYNKSMQKNLNINIINYKHFKGRYIIYGQNGIGKEYNGKNDRLIFEGEYKNGQRNGEGKEYATFGLYFVGNYLNGKRHGKGVMINRSQKIFEGEYLNGQRNGKGKEYHWNKNLRFEGEYLNDKEWNGTRYSSDRSIDYQLNNSITGQGKEYGYNSYL